MRAPSLLLPVALALLSSWSGAAHAGRMVFAVLPTKAGPEAVTDAELATNLMRIALQERRLMLVPAASVAASVAANQAACAQSPVACARLVGQETGATRVLASELFAQGGVLDLRVVVVDIASETEPGPWRSFLAADRVMLGVQAQQAAVQLAQPEAYFGRLSVTMAPGAEVLVDGVARDRTPLFAPLQLTVGRHEVEVRAGRLVPWRGFVSIGLEQTTTLTFCAPGDAIVTECTEPDGMATIGVSQQSLQIGGGIAAGVGVLALIGGTVAAGAASRALHDFANGDATAERRDAATFAQSAAITCFAVGGVGFVGGVVTLAVSTMVE